MNLDDLKNQWEAYDRKLDALLRFNAQAARAAFLGRARSHLGTYKVILGIEVAVGIAVAGLLGQFLYAHITAPRFVVPALAFLAFDVVLTVLAVWALELVSRIDYGSPVVVIQKQVERVRILRIRTTQWSLLLGPLLWIAPLIVAVKWIWDVDLYAGRDAAGFIAVNVLFGAVFIGIVVALSKAFAARLARSSFLRSVTNSLAGSSLMAATAHLEELASFERE